MNLNKVRLFLLEKRYYPEQNNCAYYCSKDLSDDSAAKAYAQPIQKVSTDESTEDTYKQVNKEAEAKSLNEPSCKKSSKSSNEYCQKNSHND